jgi:hypothetical protein
LEIVNQTNYHIAWIAGKKDHPADSLTLCVKGTFQLVSGAAALPAETQMLTGDIYIDDDINKGLIYDSDFAYFKENADLLLKGTCYTPEAKPVPKCSVCFAVAGTQKTLKVYGTRYASPGLLGDSASSAELFTSMPLSHENTYGGIGYQKNAVGKGRDKDENGLTWWPNVVDPNLGDKEPAGFGPINRISSQRTSKLGNYGGDYMEKRWPWFAEDFDWAYFNAATEDMQYSGYLNGDETLFMENLHPSISEYRSQLPGVTPRCFLQEHEGGEDFREVEMNLDTLYVDMDSETLSLVWRGVAEIKSHDFRELSHVYLASESLAEPAAISDYEEQFLAAITPVAIVAFEPEPDEPVVEAEPELELKPEVIEPESETDTGDEELDKLADEFKEAFAKAGLDPAIIDDIVNETIPASVIILNIMKEAGLSEEDGEKALVEIREKQVESLQEQGLSAEEVEMLMGDK